jgi:hypothetical protein
MVAVVLTGLLETPAELVTVNVTANVPGDEPTVLVDV